MYECVDCEFTTDNGCEADAHEEEMDHLVTDDDDREDR